MYGDRGSGSGGWGAVFLATCLSVSLAFCAGASAAGGVDRSFGDLGSVVTPPVTADTHTYPEGMAIGSDDEILTLQGYTNCAGGSECIARHFVQRYAADGSLDFSYGQLGASQLLEAGPRSVRYGGLRRASIALTPDGRAVVAMVDDDAVTVSRLSYDGTLDPTFGDAGTVRLDVVPSGRPLVAAQKNGKIVVAVVSSFVNGNGPLLVRLLPSGAPDPRFGSGAPAAQRRGAGVMSSSGEAPGALAISNKGTIVLAAPTCCSRGTSMRRLAGNGRPIGGSTAKRPWHLVNARPEAEASSVVALPNGKVYVVSASERRGAFAAKLLPNGHLDRRFARGGFARLRRIHWPGSLALVDDAARLLVVGAAQTSNEFQNTAVVIRRLPGGRVDKRWGRGSGFVQLLSAVGMSDPAAIGIQSNGQVVVFGANGRGCIRHCGAYNRSLVRLNGGPPRKNG